jgi:hypothetical protein
VCVWGCFSNEMHSVLISSISYSRLQITLLLSYSLALEKMRKKSHFDLAQ